MLKREEIQIKHWNQFKVWNKIKSTIFTNQNKIGKKKKKIRTKRG